MCFFLCIKNGIINETADEIGIDRSTVRDIRDKAGEKIGEE